MSIRHWVFGPSTPCIRYISRDHPAMTSRLDLLDCRNETSFGTAIVQTQRDVDATWCGCFCPEPHETDRGDLRFPERRGRHRRPQQAVNVPSVVAGRGRPERRRGAQGAEVQTAEGEDGEAADGHEDRE